MPVAQVSYLRNGDEDLRDRGSLGESFLRRTQSPSTSFNQMFNVDGRQSLLRRRQSDDSMGLSRRQLMTRRRPCPTH